ncbi:MAG TPA: hypothetical protein VGR56_01140 [Nitrososphaerales archaeon]|nr:hypothetical protein [Nitrososphaerales archaeon]
MKAAALGQTTEASSEPRRFVHRFIYCGLFFIIFGVIAWPYWYLMREVVPRSISLSNESSWFSPTIAGRVSLDYIGFVLPLAISIITLLLYIRMEAAKPPLPKSLKILMVIVPISFILSQSTPLGLFVSVGLSDPISLTAITIAEYNITVSRPLKQAALLTYPLGFAVGLLSDLESAGYFHGVFGGYGLGDGDFVFPLGFLMATVVFSMIWKSIFEAELKLEARANELMRRQGRAQLF